jgi:hypothetical protein
MKCRVNIGKLCLDILGTRNAANVRNRKIYDFFCCAGVVYSGEYDVCDVTLSVYPHRASLKNIIFQTNSSWVFYIIYFVVMRKWSLCALHCKIMSWTAIKKMKNRR